MSNWTYACCCEGGSCADCAESNTCYDTSYVIPAIDLTYTFSRNAANVRPCNQCGQSCGFAEYTITARVLAQDLVVQRVGPVGGPGGPCCYAWRGQVDVEYSLDLTVTRRCVGTNCPRVWQDSWSGTNTVDACIDVVCLECGNHEACGKTWTQERVWMHSLRVCDFDVTCSGDRNGLMGSNPSDPSGPLVCLLYTTDCDPPVAEPCDDCTVPGRLWCAGGGVVFYSDSGPLDAVGTLRCKGWRPGQLCGDDCQVYEPWVQVGPWTASFKEECDQGIPKQCEGLFGNDYPTRGFGAQIDGWLDSDCGSVDESVTGFCIDRDYLQSGCSGQGWTYT